MTSRSFRSIEAAAPTAASMVCRPLLTPSDVLFCVLPVAVFLSIVSLV